MHCLQVKALETELEQCALRKQLVQLQRQLDILDEEKKETEGRLQEEEKKNSILEEKGKNKNFKYEDMILKLQQQRN